MKTSIIVTVLAVFLLASCNSKKYYGPDPALFPKESKDWNSGYDRGFKDGFMEGLVYGQYAH